MKVKNEMPAVNSCAATQCAYNVEKNCHARAITVGHAQEPGCDTFFGVQQHSKEKKRIAGVGACKVTACKFNEDYECSAEGIIVGYKGSNTRCLTFSKR
jgi:hypothetical protein